MGHGERAVDAQGERRAVPCDPEGVGYSDCEGEGAPAAGVVAGADGAVVDLVEGSAPWCPLQREKQRVGVGRDVPKPNAEEERIIVAEVSGDCACEGEWRCPVGQEGRVVVAGIAGVAGAAE